MEQDRIVNQDPISIGNNNHFPKEPTDITSVPTFTQTGLWTKLGVVMRTELENVQLRLRFVNFILQFCPPLAFARFRTAIYRWCGIQIGYGTVVIGTLTISGAGPIFRRLKVGKMCLINAPLHLDLNAEITIGDGVSIGHHVVLITTDHQIGPADHRCGEPIFKAITIGEGCWIGARTTILPGVHVGAGAVVGAGALVTKDVPPNTLVKGVPARVHRVLDSSRST